MMPRQYIEDFAATHKTPYLGLPAGTVACRDVADPPVDVQSISLTTKSTGIEQLARLKHLTRIKSPLREDWLPAFANIPHLQYATFRLPESASIPSLACLTGLRSLVLSCNRHQADLRFVRGMNWLHSLCVSEADQVKSLAPLATLTELRELYIDGSMGGRGTVASFSPISRLNHLQYVVLQIRVAGKSPLAPLRRLQELKYLHLRDEFSEGEYDALLKALPGLPEICFNAGKRWPPSPST
jgi:hypothetical protein